MAKGSHAKLHWAQAERQSRSSSLIAPQRILDRVDYIPIGAIRDYEKNARCHPKRQLKALERSIAQHGFVIPILVDANGTVIAGHARLVVAGRLGLTEVPVLMISHLTEAEIRALRIAG